MDLALNNLQRLICHKPNNYKEKFHVLINNINVANIYIYIYEQSEVISKSRHEKKNPIKPPETNDSKD